MMFRRLARSEDGSAAILVPRRGLNANISVRSLSLTWPIVLVACVSVAAFARTMLVWAPEGDSALHLKLMQDIGATGHLPDHLPYYAARVGSDGRIEAMFPYAYTPLFHVMGAILYRTAGAAGIALMNGASAGMIALVLYRFVERRLPQYVAAASALVAFVAPTTVSIFTHVYMEPPMLAFVMGGAWYYYVALTTKRIRPALISGALLGLGVATRQVALLYTAVLGVIGVVYLFEHGALQPTRIGREVRWLGAMFAAFVTVSAPFVAYLLKVSGTIGYGDIVLPGTSTTLAVDPAANAYLSNITNPDLSPLMWVDRYRTTLLYSERWLPGWYAALPFVFAAIGIGYMEARGGGARFLARLACFELMAELVMFATVHGNDRYVIASRLLFYSTLPVGVYASSRWLTVKLAPWRRARRTAAVLIATGISCGVGLCLVGASYVQYISRQQDLMSLRSDSYAEAAAWANANTPRGALFLAPRVYSGELDFERNLTWVTFYGNSWVVDAISTDQPKEANAILRKHGVDYVLVANPPGTYVDQVPADGMRSYLKFGRYDTSYFALEYITHEGGSLDGAPVENALRIYRVVPQGSSARAQSE